MSDTRASTTARVGRWLLLCAGATILAGAIVVLLSLWDLNTPTRRARAGPGTLRVASGASFRRIVSALGKDGWIRFPRAAECWGRLQALDRGVLPGRYRFGRGWPPRRILEEVGLGRVETARITIPEGWRESQILRLLADSLEVSPDDLSAAVEDTAWIRYLGIEGGRLEGYLFPETYLFPKEYEPRDALARMVREFNARFDVAMRARAAHVGLIPHDVVTLASIVQAEAGRVSEMPRIAGVFMRRLRRGMKLEADPTVLYALDRFTGPVLWKDLEVASPYNTYREVGLPSGAIANPGADAIRAVLWPDSTGSDLYFVAKGNGEHAFSRTLAEHVRTKHRVRASLEDGSP